jgi:hypothetical protein
VARNGSNCVGVPPFAEEVGTLGGQIARADPERQGAEESLTDGVARSGGGEGSRKGFSRGWMERASRPGKRGWECWVGDYRNWICPIHLGTGRLGY